MKTHSRIVTVGLLLGLLGLIHGEPAHGQAITVTEVVKEPIDFVDHDDCTGEDIQFSGFVQDVFHVTIDANGGFETTDHLLFEALRGVGLTTGQTYRFSAAVEDAFHSAGIGFPLEATFEAHSVRIGKGGTTNEVVRLLFHRTFDANGNLTASIDEFGIDCH